MVIYSGDGILKFVVEVLYFSFSWSGFSASYDSYLGPIDFDKSYWESIALLQKFQKSTEEEKPKETSQKKAPTGTEPAAAKADGEHEFKVGDLVITSSGNEDSWDQKLACATKVLSKKCKVEFQGGSAKATEKVVAKRSLESTSTEQQDAAASKKLRAETFSETMQGCRRDPDRDKVEKIDLYALGYAWTFVFGSGSN